MYFKTLLIIIALSSQTLYSQENKSVQGAFGAVTIDGKIWNQVALRPILPFGKISIALDLVFYIDQDGNIHEDEWQFSSPEKIKNTLLDKIYYVKYGSRWKGNYFRIGALDYVQMGYGGLVNRYSNSLLYPQVRKVGMEFRTKMFGVSAHGFTNDFKENFGLSGIRFSAPISNGISMGVSWAGDRNQYLGLKDSDNDGRPDLVDDFPDNDEFWLDSDNDGLADDSDLEWDIDGDGVTDVLDNKIPGWNLDTIIVLDTNIIRKPEPINISKNHKPIQSFGIDFGTNLVSDGPFKIDIYAQYAALLGETKNPENGKIVEAGYGIIPLGFAMNFGPAKFSLEYRMVPKGNFEFGYFNNSYEIERATFFSENENQGRIITKSSKLGYFGKQNGFYSNLTMNIGTLFNTGLTFQNLKGDQWNDDISKFEPSANQSFTGIFELKKPISKINKAQLYYQQRNVPNPFDFEYSETTIMGYNVGIKLGNGMVLNYIFRRSFQDLNGDGDVKDPEEMINMTSIETSFSF